MSAMLSPTKSIFRNYAQVRAKNALNASKKWDFLGADGSGNVVKRIPNLIIENGLLGAMAFALEKKGGHEEVFSALLAHLQCEDINDASAKGVTTPAAWFEKLAGVSAEQFRITTAECMAYLAYLRRFGKKTEASE